MLGIPTKQIFYSPEKLNGSYGKKTLGKLEIAFFIWIAIITAATAFSMFFLLGLYINDYFCW